MKINKRKIRTKVRKIENKPELEYRYAYKKLNHFIDECVKMGF